MEELYDLLDKHYIVKRNKHAGRFKFAKVAQQLSESLVDFVARIREAGSKCEFGGLVDKYKLSDTTAANLKADILEDRLHSRSVCDGLKKCQDSTRAVRM